MLLCILICISHFFWVVCVLVEQMNCIRLRASTCVCVCVYVCVRVCNLFLGLTFWWNIAQFFDLILFYLLILYLYFRNKLNPFGYKKKRNIIVINTTSAYLPALLHSTRLTGVRRTSYFIINRVECKAGLCARVS